jgi:hypothetical protein
MATKGNKKKFKCKDKVDFDVKPYQESYGRVQNSACENGLG